MGVVVKRRFKDLTDGHIYCAGDEYPRAGVVASSERVAELLDYGERTGAPLIGISKPADEAEISPESEEKPKKEEQVNKPKRRSKKTKTEN